MVNRPKNILQKIKQPFNKGLATTALILALNGGDPSFAQNIHTMNVTRNANTTNIAKDTIIKDTTDALSFATNNVDKYYPDMKEHLNTMINSFRDKEHKDSTLVLLNKMVENISDSSQKTWAIIYALEGVFRKDQSFSLKYDSKITDETFKHIEQFDNDYKAWFKRYYDRLESNIKKLEEKLKKSKQDLENSKQELEKNKQELEKNISKFTSEDIKGNPSLKQLFIATETFYKENNFQIPANIQKLFDATK